MFSICRSKLKVKPETRNLWFPYPNYGGKLLTLPIRKAGEEHLGTLEKQLDSLEDDVPWTQDVKGIMCLKLEDFTIFYKFIFISFEHFWMLGSLLEVPNTARFCHCGISIICNSETWVIDPEVLAVVQDFWSFPGTLESGACFSECWNMLEHLPLPFQSKSCSLMLRFDMLVARWRRVPSSALRFFKSHPFSNCPFVFWKKWEKSGFSQDCSGG